MSVWNILWIIKHWHKSWKCLKDSTLFLLPFLIYNFVEYMCFFTSPQQITCFSHSYIYGSGFVQLAFYCQTLTSCWLSAFLKGSDILKRNRFCKLTISAIFLPSRTGIQRGLPANSLFSINIKTAPINIFYIKKLIKLIRVMWKPSLVVRNLHSCPIFHKNIHHCVSFRFIRRGQGYAHV